MKPCLLLVLLAALAWSNVACSADDMPTTCPAAVPFTPAVPEGLGVNIHFTDPKPGEMKMLAEGGFTIVRMDFTWKETEKVRGQYDFAPYDRLLAAMEKHHIRTLFILDYGNKLYDDGNSPHTDAGRKAFAAWAVAAVRHFKGKKILWEMWNEPNISPYWTPKPNIQDYIQIALEVGKAIHQTEPNEQYIGPATSTVDFPFLEACFQAGLLEYWSAVSVHPYRQNEPESAATEYARLRRLIDKHAPKGKVIPILSSEWGYSVAGGRFDVDMQGKFLPRQWMMNLVCGVPVSIWYDWHDDGTDPKEPEHHFGTVLHPYDPNANPVYQPKPAYEAAQTLTRCLSGFHFNKRLSVGDVTDYVLLFSKGDDVRLAVWTISKTPHSILVPASPGKFTVTGHLGEAMPALTAQPYGLAPDGSWLSVAATDAPQYLAPDAPNDLLRLAAAWEAMPMERHAPASPGVGITLSLTNPLQRPVRLVVDSKSVDLAPGATLPLTKRTQLLRNAQPVPVRLACHVEGMGVFAQEMILFASNPLDAKITPVLGKELSVRVENISGEPFVGTIMLTGAEALAPVPMQAKLDFASGQTEKTVRFTLQQPVGATYRVGAVIENENGKPQAVLPVATFAPMDDFARYDANSLASAYRTLADGDPKVAGTVCVSVDTPSDGPPAPGVGALRIVYNLDKGWKFARVAPIKDEARKIDGEPKFFGLWVYGDGSGHSLHMRFLDAKGQCFQPTAESLKWKGWRFVTFPMTGANVDHWGGADDGVIRYPIRWDTLFLLDKASKGAVRGEVFIAGPMLIR